MVKEKKELCRDTQKTAGMDSYQCSVKELLKQLGVELTEIDRQDKNTMSEMA
jgi:hypothetical protein